MEEVKFGDILNYAKKAIDHKLNNEDYKSDYGWLMKLILRAVLMNTVKDLSIGVTKPLNGELMVSFVINLGDRFGKKADFTKEVAYMNALLPDATANVTLLDEEENNCSLLRVEIVNNPLKHAVRAL